MVAAALRTASSQVRDDDEAQIANYIEAAAGQVDQVASTLRDQDVMQLLRSAEDIARRQPELFMAATFVLGFAATRFLRSSSPSTGDNWRRSTYGESFNGSQHRGSSSGYEAGSYGQGYAGYDTSMVRGQGMATGTGFRTGYGSQTDTGYAAGTGFDADMDLSSQGQSRVGTASDANSGYGDTMSGGSRGSGAGGSAAGRSTGWQPGSNIDTGPEGR